MLLLSLLLQQGGSFFNIHHGFLVEGGLLENGIPSGTGFCGDGAFWGGIWILGDAEVREGGVQTLRALRLFQASSDPCAVAEVLKRNAA